MRRAWGPWAGLYYHDCWAIATLHPHCWRQAPPGIVCKQPPKDGIYGKKMKLEKGQTLLCFDKSKSTKSISDNSEYKHVYFRDHE